MGKSTGVKQKPAQPSKKVEDEKKEKQQLVKKRSLEEDELKASANASATKKAKVEAPKSDTLANPFLQAEYNEEEEEEDEEEEEEEARRFGAEYDNDEESDEEAESMRSLILEDFVLSQKSDSSRELDGIGGNIDIDYGEERGEGDGEGDGDDTISMDSDEIEAIARSATSSIGFKPEANISSPSSSSSSSTPSTTTTTTTTTSSNAKHNAKPLQNVKVVFTGFPSDYEKELMQKATELGATYLQ